MPDTVDFNADRNGIARLTLNEPERHNALSPAMIAEVTALAGEIAEDKTVRAVILTGSGKSFCAGGDLNWMREQMQADREQRMREARKIAGMLHALNTLPKPLIGRVQGNAFGGGVGMLSVCDAVIAVDTARFGLTETRLGLIPATIGPYVIARLGEARARRYFMSSRLFDCAEAHRLGLVSEMVPADRLDATVEAEAKAYLDTSPDAVASAKALARALGPHIDDSVIDMTIGRLADTWETADAREGVSAFFEKRKPGWVPQT